MRKGESSQLSPFSQNTFCPSEIKGKYGNDRREDLYESSFCGIVIAFEDYNPMSGLWHSDFVGMENFAYLFSMSDCKRVIINTLVIAVAKLILNIIVPLAFALLLNEIRQVKFKKAVQTIVYLPHFLSWVILASVLQCRYLSGSPYRYQPGALRSGSD